MKQSEHSLLVNATIEYLCMLGHWAWKNPTHGVYDPVKKIYRRNTTYCGAGDVLCVLKPDGRHAEFEIKVGKDRLSEDQKLHRAKIETRGAFIAVISSTDDLIEMHRQGIF